MDILVIGCKRGEYVMPLEGAFDLSSFAMASMEMSAALDMSLMMDLMVSGVVVEE